MSSFYTGQGEARRFEIGDPILIVDFRPKWWRHPIRWMRYKLRRLTVLVVTGVDREAGVITYDERKP